MSGRDWQAFDAELRARAPEIAAELLGKPSSRTGQEWRWGRKGSLSVVIAGAKAGMWFDHEAGTGGGLVDLVARTRGLSRREALDWTADRIGLAGDVGQSGGNLPIRRSDPRRDIPTSVSRATPEAGAAAPAETVIRAGGNRPCRHGRRPGRADLGSGAPGPGRSSLSPAQAGRAERAALRQRGSPDRAAARRRGRASHHRDDHAGGREALPRRRRQGRALCTIGGPLGASGAFLICEGWATGASLHEATGLPVVAAMDAGNLGP